MIYEYQFVKFYDKYMMLILCVNHRLLVVITSDI